MLQLQPPDLHCLSAAEGWLELGNPREALLELDHISIAGQNCLEVFAARWAVYAELNLWADCVQVASRIMDIAPDDPVGYIHRSYALHELGQTREARDLLAPAAARFPLVETIPYNLACYEAQLGDLNAAWQWFQQTLALCPGKQLAARALEDPDLRPLWPRIETLRRGRK